MASPKGRIGTYIIDENSLQSILNDMAKYEFCDICDLFLDDINRHGNYQNDEYGYILALFDCIDDDYNLYELLGKVLLEVKLLTNTEILKNLFFLFFFFSGMADISQRCKNVYYSQ